jgi:hypothetical protein
MSEGTEATQGEARYSSYLQDGGDWSGYAGDSDYYDPHAFRVGVFPSDTSGSGFYLEDTDIRFGIQITDHADDETGNDAKEGEVQFTPWASQGGGWSDFAGDSNTYDFDAARIVIETDVSPGLVITNIQIGSWVTDSGTDESRAGDKVYSDWLSGEGSWSEWADAANGKDLDSMAIYLGVETETATAADQGLGIFERDHQLKTVGSTWQLKIGKHYAPMETYILYLCAVLVLVNAICGTLYCYNKRSQQQYKVVSMMTTAAEDSSDVETDVEDAKFLE